MRLNRAPPFAGTETYLLFCPVVFRQEPPFFQLQNNNVNMKKFTFSILAALAALVGWPQQSTAATTVKTVDISLWAYYSQTSYAGADSVFSFKDFADALGTDTTTLRTSGKFVYATDIDGNLSNTYTANNMGFWFNAEGVIAAYTNKPVYYVETSVD